MSFLSLPKEVRITNVTTGNVRAPERAAYYPVIMREYLFHNQNRGNELNQLKPKCDIKRIDAQPEQSINPADPIISVDMSNITIEEQS